MVQNGTHFLQCEDIWITTPAGSLAHAGDRTQPRVELPPDQMAEERLINGSESSPSSRRHREGTAATFRR
jgi:hypothetical protein